MAVTAKWYGNGLLEALNKEIDWVSDTIKVSLHTSTYSPDQDTHDYYNDVTNEVSASGDYVAGGATLSGKTLTYTAGTNTLKLDASDVVWSGATITARYAVIYDYQTGIAATSPLIGYVDFGEDVICTSGTFTITWNSSGILSIVAG